jgi:hypothetical protein
MWSFQYHGYVYYLICRLNFHTLVEVDGEYIWVPTFISKKLWLFQLKSMAEDISTLSEQSVILIIQSNYRVSESRDQISLKILSFYANSESKCHQPSLTLK